MSDATLLVVVPVLAIAALVVAMLALAGAHLRWLRIRPRGWKQLP